MTLILKSATSQLSLLDVAKPKEAKDFLARHLIIVEHIDNSHMIATVENPVAVRRELLKARVL